MAANASTARNRRHAAASPSTTQQSFPKPNGTRASLQASLVAEKDTLVDSGRVAGTSSAATAGRRASRLQRWVQTQQHTLADEHDTFSPTAPSTSATDTYRPHATVAHSRCVNNGVKPRKSDPDADSLHSFVIIEDEGHVVNLGEDVRAAPKTSTSTSHPTGGGSSPTKPKHRSLNLLRARALNFSPRNLSRTSVVSAQISIHTADGSHTPSQSPIETAPMNTLPSTPQSSSRFLRTPFSLGHRRGASIETPSSSATASSQNTPARASLSSFFSSPATGPDSNSSLAATAESDASLSLPRTPQSNTRSRHTKGSTSVSSVTSGGSRVTLDFSPSPQSRPASPPTIRNTHSGTMRPSRPTVFGAFVAPTQLPPTPQSPPQQTIKKPRSSYGADAPPRPSMSSGYTVASGSSSHVTTAPSAFSSSATSALSAGSIGTLGSLTTIKSNSSNSSSAGGHGGVGQTPRRGRQLFKPPSLWSLPTDGSHMFDAPGSEAVLARAASPVRLPLALQTTTEEGSLSRVLKPGGRRSHRRTLVVSGVAVGDVAKEAGVRRWCETFGELNGIVRAPNGDLHIQFKSSEVAETVCRIRARVAIAGVGSVALSWFRGKGP